MQRQVPVVRESLTPAPPEGFRRGFRGVTTHFVLIVRYTTGKVIKRMGPMSERKAEKVERGATINLNHAEFHSRIVPKKEAADWEDETEVEKHDTTHHGDPTQ